MKATSAVLRRKMVGLWARYLKALDAHPLQTKMVTAFTGFMLGDVVAQAPDLNTGKPWDIRRTAKMGVFGLCLSGPVGHYWYRMLDKTIMPNAPKSTRAIITKTIIDQTTLAPVWTAGFFSGMKLMDGKPDEISSEVHEKLWPTMKVNWMVWVPAHIINFRFIPPSQRILYGNSIQVWFNVYLSRMQASQKKANE